MPDETPPVNPFYSDEPPRTMDQEEVEKLLRGGMDGVREFNRRRGNGWALGELDNIDLRSAACSFGSGKGSVSPDLRGARLWHADLRDAKLVAASFRGAQFLHANLNGANLVLADLSRASLWQASLVGANLESANLRNAKLVQAKLRGAILIEADLGGASLWHANLSHAALHGANLGGARFTKADLRGAHLVGADLTDADLRDSLGLRLDRNLVRNARFDANARDPWSVLRRAYTGPSLLFRLVPMAGYFALLAGRAAFWAGFGRAEQRAAEAVAAGANHAATMPAGELVAGAAHEGFSWITDHTVSRTVLSVVLGIDAGWLIAALTAALVLYNVMLYFVSRAVSAMRDAEERSGYSPAWRVEEAPKPHSPQWLPRPMGSALNGVLNTRPFRTIRRWLIGYQWCWQMHQIMQPLLWASILAAAWRVIGWLMTEVRMPV